MADALRSTGSYLGARRAGNVASSATIRLARDTVAVPVHLSTIARFVGIDRCDSGRSGRIAAGVVGTIGRGTFALQVAGEGDRMSSKVEHPIVVQNQPENRS